MSQAILPLDPNQKNKRKFKKNIFPSIEINVLYLFSGENL